MVRSIGIADNRGGGDNGSVSGAVTSIKEGQGSSIGLSCGHLTQGVGLSLPLSIIDTVVKSGNSSVGGRDGDGGAMGNHWMSSDAGDNSSIGLSCGHLGQGVGLSLPLAIIDTVVKSGNSRGVADNGGGVVEGDTTHLSHSGLGGIGDDTDVVKTTLSQGILGGLSSSDLGHGPGLGVSRDSRHGQAE